MFWVLGFMLLFLSQVESKTVINRGCICKSYCVLVELFDNFRETLFLFLIHLQLAMPLISGPVFTFCSYWCRKKLLSELSFWRNILVKWRIVGNVNNLLFRFFWRIQPCSFKLLPPDCVFTYFFVLLYFMGKAMCKSNIWLSISVWPL